MEYGLCCLLYNGPVRFKTFTWQKVQKILKNERIASAQKYIDLVIQHNLHSLQEMFIFCKKNEIKSYRISSDIIPHFQNLTTSEIFPKDYWQEIHEKLASMNTHGLILSMHPGQYVNVGSPTESVVKNSIEDIKYHLFISRPLKCSEINIHVGGSYGNKDASTRRFFKNITQLLNDEERSFITIENDEYNYSIEDIISIAKDLKIRATYDIHHQRCYLIRDGIVIKNSPQEEEWQESSRETWKNYEYQRMHISSPKDGWEKLSTCRSHNDFIQPDDFPKWLLKKNYIHLDIEAKFKEKSIFALRKEFENNG